MKAISKKMNMFLVLLMTISVISPLATVSVAAEAEDKNEKADYSEIIGDKTAIGSVEEAEVDGNKVTLTLDDGNKTQFTFLNDILFRYYVDISDEEFKEYPTPRSEDHEETITVKPDSDFVEESKVTPELQETAEEVTISTESIDLVINKETSMLKVLHKDGTVAMEEAAPVSYKDNKTTQTLTENEDEYFYGGGTQNGRFSHKGKVIQAANTNNWVDGGVTSPNPFYWSTKGYGVLRNTWQAGTYNFGNDTEGLVSTTHNEGRFDSYIMIGDKPEALLNSYTDLTGKPAHQPDSAMYLAHLNCYNRDYWSETGNTNDKKIDGKYYKERQPDGSEIRDNEKRESLMPKDGNDTFTAKRQLDIHAEKDLPLGSLFVNDGYGCGYGQTDTFEGDIEELGAFADYSKGIGIDVGLWTQENLWPADKENPQKGERDFEREVEAGVTAIKTDVAWVGQGYSMALDGVMRSHDAITEFAGVKPFIISLDGWGGTQRHAGVWSGDQSGGNWEYIRFHIPTYIGTGLSGMPYVGSDMDGIFGGKDPIIQTRDFQWKAFTPFMLDMDGWGSSQKNPWEFGEDNTSINRAYLKLKAEMTPYINTMVKRGTETGMPLVRAMMLEYPEEGDYVYSDETDYQFMWGDSLLVAPIYQNTASDAAGNDIRNDIFLPDEEQIWIDYFSGEQYRGGTVLNNFDAPIWKTPVFVKNGAIIPMFAENNNPRPVTKENPMGTDRSQRIVEFYPEGKTSFDLYEDDGINLDSYEINTEITSEVADDKATLSMGKAVGTFDGMEKERDTEFIVNVSEKPTAVTGNVKDSEVEFTEVSTREEYDAAEGNVYLYEETPLSVINKYASEDSTYDEEENMVETTPKLSIKANEKVDITEHSMTVEIDGFVNEQEIAGNEVIEDLAIPKNFKSVEETDSTIHLTWDEVEAATSYDIEIDGLIYSNIKEEYIHKNLDYETDYNYRIRSVNDEGHSEWSEILTVTTDLDAYRNVPDGMTAEWTGNGSYHGSPNEAVDKDSGSHFHSKDSGDALNNTFTIDMKKMFDLEKFEYVPRNDFGNGTIQEFLLESSVDGKHWQKVTEVGKDVPAWTYSDKEKDTLQTLTFDETINTRFLRISVTKSVGGFLTAHEFRPYTTEGDKGQLVGDWNNDGVIDEGDLTFFDNYVGARESDASFAGYVEASDVNFDGVIDAYDISYVARLLEGGVKPVGKDVNGTMSIVPSKETAKAGEEVTYTVHGQNMENVYAFNLEIPYDDAEFEHVSTRGSSHTESMRNFNYNRTHTDGTKANYIVYTNVGDQELINGTDVIAEFTMKQLVEGSTELPVLKANFVGDNLSVVDALGEYVEPEPDTEKILDLSDIESLTFTNSILEDDDGSNGSKLFEQANYEEILFDGNTAGDLAEFKWFIEGGDIPEYVILPTTFHIDLKNDEAVTKVNVYNRASSNGAVTSIKATAFFEDQEFDLGTIKEHQDKFEFVIPNDGEMIDRIEITPLSSSGRATGTETGAEENRMLSLYEIEIVTSTESDDDTEPEDDVEAAEKVKRAIYNLPRASELTLADKAKVEKVREMVNNLSDKDKEFVTAISQLEAREAKLDQLESDRQVKEVKRAIYNLPRASGLTLADKAKVEEVREMVNNLSDEDKALVTTISQLEAREDKLTELAN